jgi:hypothetical protein
MSEKGICEHAMTLPINPRSSVCIWPFNDVKINYKITRDRLCMYSNIKLCVDVVVGVIHEYTFSVYLSFSYQSFLLCDRRRQSRKAAGQLLHGPCEKKSDYVKTVPKVVFSQKLWLHF